MNLEQQHALLAITLFAAFADGEKHDREREEIRRIADALAGEAGAPDLAKIYQDVLLKRVRLEAAAAALVDAGERQLAYEMAVGVCEADGSVSPVERHFLDALKTLLKVDAPPAELIEGEANALAELSNDFASEPSRDFTSIAASSGGPVVAAQANMSEAELDKSILNYSLLNGALELLPQSWASMAIIPLQIKMVYGIGRAHGVTLDQGHIKEFIAAAGVGLTSQYLEQIGRKLLGGLLGKMAGKTFGKVGGAATGIAFSFATTYALGQLAKRYYAGGRRMDSTLLRDTFQNMLGPAKQMQMQYLPQIRQQAENLDMGRVMAMVRGGR